MSKDDDERVEAVAEVLHEFEARLDALEKSLGVVMLTLSRYQPPAMDMLIEGFEKWADSARRENLHTAEIETYESLGKWLRDFQKNVLGNDKTPTPPPPNRPKRRRP